MSQLLLQLNLPHREHLVMYCTMTTPGRLYGRALFSAQRSQVGVECRPVRQETRFSLVRLSDVPDDRKPGRTAGQACAPISLSKRWPAD